MAQHHQSFGFLTSVRKIKIINSRTIIKNSVIQKEVLQRTQQKWPNQGKNTNTGYISLEYREKFKNRIIYKAFHKI